MSDLSTNVQILQAPDGRLFQPTDVNWLERDAVAPPGGVLTVRRPEQARTWLLYLGLALVIPVLVVTSSLVHFGLPSGLPLSVGIQGTGWHTLLFTLAGAVLGFVIGGFTLSSAVGWIAMVGLCMGVSEDAVVVIQRSAAARDAIQYLARPTTVLHTDRNVFEMNGPRVGQKVTLDWTQAERLRTALSESPDRATQALAPHIPPTAPR